MRTFTGRSILGIIRSARQRQRRPYAYETEYRRIRIERPQPQHCQIHHHPPPSYNRTHHPSHDSSILKSFGTETCKRSTRPLYHISPKARKLTKQCLSSSPRRLHMPSFICLLVIVPQNRQRSGLIYPKRLLYGCRLRFQDKALYSSRQDLCIRHVQWS